MRVSSPRTGVARRDGRAARAQRTRRLLIVALLELIDEGDLRPTANRIAERAEVCPRSVYQHFPDRELLFAAALERLRDHASTLGAAVQPDTPFPDRLATYVQRRATSWEMLSPILRAVATWEPFSDPIGASLAALRLDARAEIQRTFASELTGLGRAERASVLAMVVVAGDWATWDNLRNKQGLTINGARKALRLNLGELLASTPSAPKRDPWA